MSSTTELINSNFGGIRRKHSAFGSELITCSDCQNVELYSTGINSGVGLRTVKGNVSCTDLIPAGEQVVGLFETIQNGISHTIVYTELEGSGTLYNLNLGQNTLTTLVSGLKATGNACGVDFKQGWSDYFVFSNGEDIKYIYTDTNALDGIRVETDENIHLIDTDNRTVKGLGLINYDSRLWVFDGKVLWYSKKEDCRVFNFVDTSVVGSSGYIEFSKDITAIHEYLGSLAVFHKNSSALVKTDATTIFKVEDESPGGCASYNSLVYHGTDLYFYDDTKKGVFSFQQIVNGDKTLGDNIAEDIQEELLQIRSSNLNKIKALSVVTKDRDEVWFLIPISEDPTKSIVMIFDYGRGEWVKRKCQHINTMAVVDSKLYSTGESIYEEYTTDLFDGEFIDSFYTCSILNLGKDNTLKITKFPPRIAVDASYKNHFFVKYIKNYNVLKQPKIKEIKTKSLKNILVYDSGNTYDTIYSYQPNTVTIITKLPSASFKALEITFYTEDTMQEFCIKSLELSSIKVKQV